MWLEKKYIAILGQSLRNFKQKDSNLYNFSCPFCGDSETNSTRSRGYIYMREQKFFYRCHNCGHSTTFLNVLRNLNPVLFKEYSFERYKNKTPEKKEFIYKPQPVRQTSTMFLDMVASRISNLPADDTAVKYLADRKIPKEKWTDLFYLEDLNLLKKISQNMRKSNFI